MIVIWCDSDDDNEGETIKFVTDFTRKCVSKDEDMSIEESFVIYGILHRKWEESCVTMENQKRIIRVFQKEKEMLISPSQVWKKMFHY